MLPLNWHRHFAKKRALEFQERRLLCNTGNGPNEEQNPEEEVETEETPEREPTAEGVDNTIGSTRGAVDGVISNPEDAENAEAEKVSFDGIEERIQNARAKLYAFINRQGEIRELIKNATSGSEQADHLREFEDTILLTEMAKSNLNDYERVVRSVSNFTNGSITPEIFIADYSDALGKSPSDIRGFDVESITRDLDNIDAQQLTDQERGPLRNEVFQAILNEDEFQNSAKFISDQMDVIEGSIGKVESYTEELDDANIEDDKPGMTWSSFWANSMSINDMINGAKKYIEAYKKSYEEWNQLKEARFAQSIGEGLAWIPLGQQTKTVLNRQTESANDSVRDEHKQGLEAQKPSFSQVVDMIHSTKNANPNHFRALLEYAADRAWLYNYDGVSGTVFGINIANYLPETWTPENREEYLRELDNKNGSGQDTEKTRGYDLVSTESDIPPIIETLHDQLSRGNYWASYGILKRALEKGKEGETSTWISVTIFRYLRDNPSARKHFPIQLLDDIGNIGIGHPAWTSTWFKFDRGTIVPWQKTTEESPKNAGKLGKVISVAEKHLVDKLGSSILQDKRRLDRYVGKILASQTITINGVKFSIFDERYDEYRKQMQTAPTAVDAKLADEDFYNFDTGGSEIILLGNKSYKNMLNLTSLGEFADTQRSSLFMEQLIKRKKDIEKEFGSNSPQYHNYTSAIRDRLKTWLLANANDDRASEKIGFETLPGDNSYIFLSLVKSGLIDLKSIYMLDKSKLSKIITRQIIEDGSEFMTGAQMLDIAKPLKESGQMTDARYLELERIVNPIVTRSALDKQNNRKARDGSNNPSPLSA